MLFYFLARRQNKSLYLGGIKLRGEHGFFIPVKSNKQMPKIENSELCVNTLKNAFFKYMTEENSHHTINCFIDAIERNCLEDALSYISKNYMDRVDIGILADQLENGQNKRVSFVVNANFIEGPKNCLTNTLVFTDKEKHNTKLFHIYMLTEPDRFGKWKIYSIEQE